MVEGPLPQQQQSSHRLELELARENRTVTNSSRNLRTALYDVWAVMAGGLPFPAALGFLEGLNRSLLVPALPLIAGSLEESANVPLIVALLSGCLYAGRSLGAFWWLYHHSLAHPGSHLLNSSDMMAAGVLYMGIYVAMGFAKRLPVLVFGQLLIGFIAGRDSCRTRASPSVVLMGSIVGPLLVLVSFALLPEAGPLAFLAVLSLAVVATILTVFVVGVLRDNFEPSHAHDSSYQRLDLDGHQPAAVLSAQRQQSSIRSLRDGKGGEPSPVEVVVHNNNVLDEDDVIPQRYVRGCQGDMEEAARRWRETLEWRRDEHVDQILSEPQPNYALIKECYPHFVHRRDRLGHPVYYELLGRINLKRIKSSGVTLSEMLRYYTFLTEYIWTHVEPDFDHGALVSVLDVENVGIMDLRGDALEFLKAASRIIQAHYVERSYKMFIVNAPGWFSVIWKVITPLLNENTRRKINIVGKDLHMIQECVDPRCLPTRYGGTDSAQLGEAPEEQGFLEYCRVLKETGYPPGQTATAGTVGPAASTASEKGGGTGQVYRPVPIRQPQGGGTLAPSEGKGRAGEESDEDDEVEVDLDLSEGEEEEDEEAPGGGGLWTRWRQVGETIVSPGLNLLDRVKAVGRIIQRDGQAPPPQANLGRENKFVYDHAKGQWVLQDPSEEDVVEDECEEHLIRAIQAAHTHDDTPGGGGSGGGAGGAGSEAGTSARSPTPDDMSSQPIVPGSVSRGASHRSTTSSPYRRRRSPPADPSTRCGPVLLFIVFAMRCFALSTIEVVPLYLWTMPSDNRTTTDTGALLLALGACLTFLLYVTHQSHCAGRYSFLSTFRVVLGCVTLNTLLLALIGPLASLGPKATAPVLCLLVLLTACSLLLLGGAPDWAADLLETLYKTEPQAAKYQLISVTHLVDVIGAVLGPLIFYFSGVKGEEAGGGYYYPLGASLWFSVAALLSAVACVSLVSYGCRPVHRNMRHSI